MWCGLRLIWGDWVWVWRCSRGVWRYSFGLWRCSLGLWRCSFRLWRYSFGHWRYSRGLALLVQALALLATGFALLTQALALLTGFRSTHSGFGAARERFSTAQDYLCQIKKARRKNYIFSSLFIWCYFLNTSLTTRSEALPSSHSQKRSAKRSNCSFEWWPSVRARPISVNSSSCSLTISPGASASMSM